MAYTVVSKKTKNVNFTKYADKVEDDDRQAYVVKESSLEEKQKILNSLGQPDLIELFKDWKPRNTKKPKTAPLDQRISLTISKEEKILLDNEIKALKQTNKNISGSQIIRSRALSSVDINEWKNIAIKSLQNIDEINKNQTKKKKRKREILAELELIENDDEAKFLLEKELTHINDELNLIVAQNVKRNVRLAGRMSIAESETMKWRAQRLCLSSSDYMRMMLFGYEPNSIADSHLSLDSKKRFYISIIDVASNGWGNPPNLVHCNQCALYLEEIEKLNDRLKQYETFE